MDYNYYFDVSATFLYAAMIFLFLYRKKTKTLSGKIFIFILVDGMISGISDIVALAFHNQTVMYVSQTVYLFFRGLAPLLFCVYAIILTDNWHRFKKYGILVFLLVIPFLAFVGFLVANYFNGWFFEVGNGTFDRGLIIHYGLVYAPGTIYLTISGIYILVYRKFFNKSEMVALVAIYPLIAIAVIIEYFFGNILIEVFASSIANLLVLSVIEKPEVMYDTEIGLKKYGAFVTDSFKASVTKKEVTLVFVKVVNEFQLNQKLNYVEQVEYRRTIGDIIKETAKDFSLKGDFYWLGQGQYAAALISQNEQNSESYSMTLRRRLNVPIKTHFGIMDLYSNVASAKCPYDIDTSDKSMAFIENFYHIGGVLDDVLNLSKVENRIDFEIKMNLSTIIKQAIMNDSLEVYYQPIYSVKDNAFTRAEALLRLKDEKYGFISPSLFLPEAERNGTIYKIGDIVFDSVCKFIASDEFKQCGLEKIEINLSVIQCMHEDLPIHIMDAIKRYGVSPDKINLDIKETSDAYSKKMMDENIKILKDLGFSFSLDDYGSGYSNMNNISALPVETIKVDNSKAKNPDVQVMIDHSIQMIRDLKRQIIVEGVETEEMLNNYEGYLCDYIQGFYFSKPLPKDDFINFVLKENAERKANNEN